MFIIYDFLTAVYLFTMVFSLFMQKNTINAGYCAVWFREDR